MRIASRSVGMIVTALVILGLMGWWFQARRPTSGPVPATPAVVANWHEVWRDAVGAKPAGAPVWVADGWCASFRDGTVVAWHRDGRRRWTLRQAGMRWTAPSTDGTSIFIGTSDGTVRALRPTDGAVIWFRQLEGAAFEHSPVVLPSADGAVTRVVALSAADGVLTALEAATGVIDWQSEPTSRTDGAAAVSDGLIVYGNCDSAVHLFGATNGVRQGRISLGEQAQMAAGLAVSGGMAFGLTRAGSLVGLDLAAQTVVWQAAIGSEEYFTTPAVDVAREIVFTGTPSGEIVALRGSDGVVLWRRALADGPLDAPLYAAATLFVGADGTLFLLDPADGTTRSRFTFGLPLTPPAAAADPVAAVMVVTEDGFAVVIGP